MTTLAYLFIAAIVAMLFHRAFPGLAILPRWYRVGIAVAVGLAWFPAVLAAFTVVCWEALKS